MANQYYDNAGQSQITKNKVFINPNYNRKPTDNSSHLNTMYLNPHFCNPISHTSYQKNDATRSKIYVNPNFLRNNSYPLNSQPIASYQYHHSQPNTHSNIFSPESNVLYQYSNTSTTITPTQVMPDTQVSTHVTNSRYCLVNKQENKMKPTNKQTNTVSVNKYKLVPLKDVQSKLYTEKKFNAPSTITSNIRPSINKYKNKVKPIVQNLSSTSFKLVKNNTANLNYAVSKLKLRRTSILNKSLTKTFAPPRKVVKSILKKNNIPCPLFKKYGKCLRKIRGTCEYLHDKKHVSICRKFLKGICHDELCLLSHDLTDKKMPTCYFYLQGACTKENCPYLHVKLNDKARVCLDFLKGYCEKGDKCLHRHVNIALNIKSQERNQIKKIVTKKSTVHIKSKIKSKASKEDMKASKEDMKASKEDMKANKEENDETELKIVSEKRYFKETIVTETNSDVIRPTRCKLGSLPSFIQL